MMWRYWIGLAVSLFIVACGAAQTGASGSNATSPATEVVVTRTAAGPASATSATHESPVATASPSILETPTADAGIVVVWTRSGGFAGRTESMTVYHDGTLMLDQDGVAQTAQGDIDTIRALEQTFVSVDWTGLKSVYGRPVPDAFAYTVQAGGISVTTYDGAETPAILDDVLEQLNSLYGAVPLEP